MKSHRTLNGDVWYNGKSVIRIKAMPRSERTAAVFTSPLDNTSPVNEVTQRTLEHFIRETQAYEIRYALFDRYSNTEPEDIFFSALLSGDRDVSVMVADDVDMARVAHFFVTWARNYSPIWAFN